MQRVVLELPDELIERAKSVGMELQDHSEQIIALLDAQIRRREAAQFVAKTSRLLQAVPDDIKPTLDEIDAEIRGYWL
ncbi:MAG: hypothetical protein IT320_19260 [Anaerolineae bacterium]|nr:hypothetical protein [Anaerolineae bacterium]